MLVGHVCPHHSPTSLLANKRLVRPFFPPPGPEITLSVSTPCSPQTKSPGLSPAHPTRPPSPFPNLHCREPGRYLSLRSTRLCSFSGLFHSHVPLSLIQGTALLPPPYSAKSKPIVLERPLIPTLPPLPAFSRFPGLFTLSPLPSLPTLLSTRCKVDSRLRNRRAPVTSQSPVIWYAFPPLLHFFNLSTFDRSCCVHAPKFSPDGIVTPF